MDKRTTALTTLTFSGAEFDDHGLELDALDDLVAYKKLVVACAKELWKKRHSDRERLPRGFEESIQLKFYTIERGSTSVPVKWVYEVSDGESETLLHDGEPVVDAALLIEDAINSVVHDGALPEEFPSNVIPLFEGFGRKLGPSSYIELKAPGRTKSAHYTQEIRRHLSGWEEAFYTDQIDIAGEVRQADLDGCNFALRTPEGHKITGKFSLDQEEIVTDALRTHATRCLRVVGEARFVRATGKPDRFSRIDCLDIEAAAGSEFDATIQPLWKSILEIGDSVPGPELDKLPVDFARNVDRYLNND